MKLSHVDDEELTALLSRQYGVPSVNLADFEIDPAIISILTAETAQKYSIVPLGCSGGTLTLAMIDPTNVLVMDDIKFMTGYHVEPVVASETAIEDAVERYYGAGRTAANTLEVATRELANLPQLHHGDVEVLEDLEQIDVATLERQGGEAPVIRLVNLLMMSAIQKEASDIHFEPSEKEARVRFRIDGTLYNVMVSPNQFRDAIASRIKIMAKLDIAEKRLPQDGRIRIRFSDNGHSKDIDFRVSCLPTLFGEKIVLRLLDKETLMLDMTKLGFEPEPLARYEAAISRPWGMVLVTGPTGSGKTNTLYSSISRINTAETNILTAEDPVEFNLAGINQVQVRDSIGLTFAAALRSFLRQDPNVILVGEIRDVETAEIAIKAALTGHLVLSTVHTNDAPSTVSRLMNMGIEPYLVASSINLICAQRLVRRICQACKAIQPMPVQALIDIGFDQREASSVTPQAGAGCEKCSQTGYRGRIGLFEVLEVSDAMRELILTRTPGPELRRRAIADGMLTLRQSGLRKIKDGITTVEEVVRETAR